MVSGVILPGLRIFVVPLTIVDRRPHLLRIAMVHVLAATVILIAVEVLWIINVGVVIEPVPVLLASGSAPYSIVGSFLSLHTRSGNAGH